MFLYAAAIIIISSYLPITRIAFNFTIHVYIYDYTPREDNTIFYCLCTFPNSLQTSSHRGGDRYRTVGRQCTFNPLTFLLMTVKKDVEDWTSETLDRILRNGDHQHQPWRKSVSTCHRH